MAGFPQQVPQTGFWAYRALIAAENGVFAGVDIPADIRRCLTGTQMLQAPGYAIREHSAEPMGFLFFRFSSREQMERMMQSRYREIRVRTVPFAVVEE